MKKPYVFLLFVLLLCGAAFAQKDAKISVSVDKTSILIGEPLRITIAAGFSKTHALSFPSIDSFPHFEILNRSKIDTQATADRVALTQHITVTSWDSGAWIIPALLRPAATGVATRPIAINVTFTPMPPAQEYHDIKDIIDVAKPPRTTWYWYLAGAVLLLLLLLLLFPKKKKGAVAETAVAKESAAKRALKQLEVLKNKNPADDKAYFTELILIFRTYLQQGNGIHSFQQTTDDLGRQLEQLQLPHEDLKKLVHTLQLSDFVKFARYSVTAGERENAWEEIKKNIVAIEQLKK